MEIDNEAAHLLPCPQPAPFAARALGFPVQVIAWDAAGRGWRLAGEPTYSGNQAGQCLACLLLLRFQSLRTADAGAVVAAMRSGFETRPEVREVRVLAHATEREGTNFLGLVASRVPPPAHLDLIGAYTPF